MNEKYYPCIKDWTTGEISKRVGRAMSFNDAVQHLKQHYSGAWQQATACPQITSHSFFSVDEPEEPKK